MEQEIQKLTEDVGLTLQDILEYKIISIGNNSLSVYEVLAAILVAVIGMIMTRMVKKFIYKTDRIDVGKKFAFSQIFRYIIIFLTFFLVMKALGVDVTPILIGSSAILVGIGLGLQNLILDFISGVIILLDRTIRVGDVIDLDGIIGQVEEIQMRTTTIRTRENKSMIFPNSVLTKDKLINFSHNDNIVRFSVDVGVHYDSDIQLVERLMLEAAKENKDVFNSREPKVWLQNFGDSSLDFTLYYYSRNLFQAPRVRNEIRKSILLKFRENGVNIPFPIRTLEFPKGYLEANIKEGR